MNDGATIPSLIAGDFPTPAEGFAVTHLLIVTDQDRSRGFYAEANSGPAFILHRRKS